MIELNSQNGSDRILRFVQSLLMKEFPDDFLIGVEMGIAYGGSVEALGKLWKGRGMVYGFDTFEGQPKQLATSPDSYEATCLDSFYEKYGRDQLSADFINNDLVSKGILNVDLVKGIIDDNSCWNLPKIHYAFLDLDILSSMKDGYESVRHRMVDGGFLCLHDVVGHKQLPELHNWYCEIKQHPQWEVIFEGEKEYLAVLRRCR
jgi:hypothetical protein